MIMDFVHGAGEAVFWFGVGFGVLYLVGWLRFR